MTSQSLAVRYRPRTFADVAGQRHVRAVLLSAARRRQPPPQLLLSGPSGLGKTTLARILAAALFCIDPSDDGDACGRCAECVAVADGSHPDVFEFDAASNGGVAEVRAISERVVYAPLRANWKVYIIDEAHGLTGAGAQAALKLIEEPPSHVIFVLATTEPDKVTAALRGRCTWLEVLRPTDDEIASNLQRVAQDENWELTDDLVDAVLAATDPELGMRGTLMTLEKISGPLSEHLPVTPDDVEGLLGAVSAERLAAVTDAVKAGDRGKALIALSKITGKVGETRVRQQLLTWARREMLQAFRTGAETEMALHRFETIAEAGTHPGALEVAVARASQPALADTIQAVRALIEKAASLPHVEATPPPSQIAPAEPTPAGTPHSTGSDPAETAEAPAVAAPVAASDPQYVAVLNTIGRVNSRAATLLRRARATRKQDGTFIFQLPQALASKAEAESISLLVTKAQPGAVVTFR